ncbi:MAG: ferrous iron transport protein A [Leptospiraceae bacterium]|nr:ferrous iron transport protein A [Leptospiraceae bacterium]
MKKNLTSLELNEVALIDSLNQEKLKAEYVIELIDYGFFPGTEISVLQKYPSQNKIIVQIGKSHLSLRMDDAEYIQVSVNGN